ncbi:MAG TPA: hypothetical protein VK921_09965 [Anditalea sp.]|nr:hypothetical protein [Anditalea sp.]
MIRHIFLLLIFFCGACRTTYHQDYRIDVNPNLQPLDSREAVLINGLKGLSYSESELIITNIQEQLRSNGFLETYSSEELEVELLSAGITDFSIQRNVDRLYSELGIVYLLQVDILNRRKAGRGKLSQLSAANREFDRNHVTMYDSPESMHLVDIQYSLYQTDLSDTLAVYRVHAAHKWDNTFRPQIIRSNIQRLIDFCNIGIQY